MRFAYYDRLSRRDQAVYRRSDGVTALPLRDPEALAPAVERLRAALARDDASEAAVASAEIAGRLSAQLGASPPVVQVLAVRPSEDWGELQGLYTQDADEVARIRVWMRTARKGNVVAFRTFLRTLLHELCHHLDFEVLGLSPSFHTEGFFRRESSLMRQLAPARPRQGALPLPPPGPPPGRRR
ncbi:MAG TPA: hypothetical protein VFL83_09270 [Anaeromyxobacter sp.]|nr:hypothetical protein [Anaeromyxobacter sp.]